MSTKQKFLFVVLAGWIVPIACILAGKGALSLSLVAVAIAIAWWHGYMAARIEHKLAVEKSALEQSA